MKSEPEPAHLDVYLGNDPVGQLRLDEKRRFVFQYDANWLGRDDAVPLSLSLPLRKEVYAEDSARPFFANLLPEGEIKRTIARRLQISARNDFAMLNRIGGECAGAVSLFPAGTTPDLKPGYIRLDEEALRRIITDLHKKPLMAGMEGMRLSLAGAQNKLPVYMEEGDVFIASGNSPSTHILKPPIRDLAGTVENETFCMMLAREMDLPVPPVAMRRDPAECYIVERYDRRRDLHGRVERLHQEDFCQALGFLPDQKYENEGGPSLSECFRLLQEKSISPSADRLVLLQWTIFNFLIGNADAHAKNLAIIFTPVGPKLAPFYDLICTRIYPELTERLAMKIGGENRPPWIQTRHWRNFADAIGIKANLVFNTLTAMGAKILPAAGVILGEYEATYGRSEVIEKIIAVIEKNTGK
ncbi:MAG: type II toxin-antitoxin system HipA family toxin [Syntrophales bacterium]|jgi:serine/threonine-protein kinase HipA|nr:type II toxin-antitoxin system HipA family toxin [Syntrophales bacterium]